MYHYTQVDCVLWDQRVLSSFIWVSCCYRNQAKASEDTQNYYHPVKAIETSHMQTTEEKAVDKAIDKLTCFETQEFCLCKSWKMWPLFMVWCCCAWAVVLDHFARHLKIWTNPQVVWHHAERHAFRKLFYMVSQYGQHSWEELKWSVAPIRCSWFYRCLLSKPDSSPKLHLYMLHMHDMINLPFSGNTRLAVFVLHSLYLYLSDWKIPSWIPWP